MPKRIKQDARTGAVQAVDVPPKFAHLLDDPNVARWHRNLGKGSPQTAKEYLRTLGAFLEGPGQTPAQFIAMGQRACEDALHDFVDHRLQNKKAGSSTQFFASVIQAWMKWNDIPLRREVKVPRRNFNPRVKGYHIPTLEEQRRALAVCDGRQKLVVALIGHAGIRPGAIGNFAGDDGLRFSDLPDAHFEGKELEFDVIPTRVVVREELSKAKHEYFTFLGPEGCDYLAANVRQRFEMGEAVGPSSPILASQRGGGFMLSESVGDLLRRPMRQVQLNLPPYIWRSFFDNRTLMAEANGMQRDYRVFHMGHKGDIEHVYALRKRVPDDMLKQMREAYSKALPLLESRTLAPQVDPMKQLAESVMRAVGVPTEEVSAIDIDGMDQAAIGRLFIGALSKGVAATQLATTRASTASPRKVGQKIATLQEARILLAAGWKCTMKLADDAFLIEAP